MKPENLRRWTIPINYLSDVPVSRYCYKTVSKSYENSNKYIQFCIKQNPEYYIFILLLIDIIDNIMTSTSANGSAVYWSRDLRLYHVTTILHCLWLKLMWRVRVMRTIRTIRNNIINYIYSKCKIKILKL